MNKEDLIFASNNINKAIEIKGLLQNNFHIITLKEAGIDIDIAEPFDTFEENAREKSRNIYQLTKKNCFSEDTGLEVSILHNEPGVKSARYAGENRSSEANLDKLLAAMNGMTERSARFRTVISLIKEGRETQFEGICKGLIVEGKRGTNGFGYDPVFVPDGSNKTFAEMAMEEKNIFSHRKKAFMKMMYFLNEVT